MFRVNDELALEHVDVLLIDPDKGVRALLRNLLMDQGFRRITVGASMSDIRDKFELAMPDLLITDLNIQNGDLRAFIYGLRHHELGSNPFMPIIITAWSPTTQDIQNIIQSGADDIISKPLSSAQLLRRITKMIKTRKPFVVTSSYIGPDRRKPGSERDGHRKTVLDPIEVPNTLRAKAMSKFDDRDGPNIQAQIDACIKKVNLEKLRRHSDQVEWLVERIVPGLEKGHIDAETLNHLKRLRYVSQDITRRMIGTKFEHVGELCTSLTDVTKAILATQGPVSPKDIELLKPLAQSIRRGFDESDESATRTAQEISSTVSRKGR